MKKSGRNGKGKGDKDGNEVEPRNVLESAKLKWLSPGTLKKADWNPSGDRCDATNLAFMKLYKNMELNGQIEAVTVLHQNGLYYIVEGHRRVAVCEMLGIKVMCVVWKKMEWAKTYASLNDTKERLNGRNKLYNFIHESDSVTRKDRLALERYEREFGFRELVRLCDLGASLSLFENCKCLFNKLSQNGGPLPLLDIVKWALRKKQIRIVREGLAGTVPIHSIRMAVESDSTVKMRNGSLIHPVGNVF